MNESRTRNSFINMGFNFMNQIVTLVLSFISRTIFIHVLGVQYLGINSLFSDVLNLLSMADLGFGTAMVYSFYKPLAEHDYSKIAALTGFYRKVYRIIAIVVSILGIIIIPFLDILVKTDEPVDNLVVYYLLSLAGVIVSYVCIYKTSILSADQKNYIVIKITIIINIIKTVIQIFALLAFKNYIVYLLIGIIMNLLNNVIASYEATKKYPFIQENIKLSKKDEKEIFNNIKSVFLYKVSSVLLYATDNMVISIILGTVVVGYYSNYLMIQNKIIAIISLIFSSLTASVGNIIVKEGEKKRIEIFQCEQTVSFMICGIVIPCYANLINDLITIWLGKDYIFSMNVVMVISINMYLACILQPLWSYREATGIYQKTKWIMFICAVINLILSVLLGKIIGIAGVLIASVISRLVTYVWYEPKLLFNIYFNDSSLPYFKEILKNFLYVLGLSYLIFSISSFVEVSNWMKLIIKGCCFVLILGIWMLVLYHKTPGFILLREKIIGKIFDK